MLLVDDERAVRVSAARMLELCGMTVTTSDNAESALSIVATTPIDIVLLDLTMPGATTGATVEALRTTRALLPIVLTSGYSAERVADLIAQPGIAFITKPYSVEDLLSKLAETQHAAAVAAASRSTATDA